MRPDDVPVAERISDRAFHELDMRTFRRDRPDPEPRSPEHSQRWTRRTLDFVEQDPGGCWVAEDETGVLGFATSFVRERVWCLATYAVRPGAQGKGIGRPLLDAALAYGDRCDRGMLAASVDARAVRRYWRAGFALHPQMVLEGDVDRSGLAATQGVREGRPDDRELMDEIVRGLRGGGHGAHHAALADGGRCLVAETATGRGFAYTDDHRLHVLAATDEATAVTLLRECLAGAGGRYVVPHVTGVNQWAVDTGLAAGLELGVDGYLGVRGMGPPAPYVHNGALL